MVDRTTRAHLPSVRMWGFDRKANGTIYNEFEGTSLTEKFREQTVTYGPNYTDWKRRIASNRQATTSLSGTSFDPVVPIGDCVSNYGYTAQQLPNNLQSKFRDYGYGVLDSDYTWPSASTAGVISLTDAKNEAKRRFLGKLAGAQRAIQGGVALGELRETLQMIRRPAKGLRNAVDRWQTSARKLRSRSLRRTNGQPRSRRVAAARRDLADSWLEYSFGWSPFLNDIEDATRALNRRNEYVVDPIPIAGYGSAEALTQQSKSNLLGQLCQWQKESIKTTKAEVRIFGKTTGYVVNPLKFNARLWGFRPRDFVPTIWELTPYSFLIDYFVNIGDVLEAWSWGRTGLAWAKGAELRKATTRLTYMPYKYTNTHDYGGSSTGGFEVSTSLKYRYAWNDGFLPEVTFRVPGSDSLRWLNIAALIAARRSDRRFRL